MTALSLASRIVEDLNPRLVMIAGEHDRDLESALAARDVATVGDAREARAQGAKPDVIIWSRPSLTDQDAARHVIEVAAEANATLALAGIGMCSEQTPEPTWLQQLCAADFARDTDRWVPGSPLVYFHQLQDHTVVAAHYESKLFSLDSEVDLLRKAAAALGGEITDAALQSRSLDSS